MAGSRCWFSASDLRPIVARIAPRFLDASGRYNGGRIVEEIIGKKRRDIPVDDYDYYRKRVGAEINRLKVRGLLAGAPAVKPRIKVRHDIKPFGKIQDFLAHVERVSGEIAKQPKRETKPRQPLGLRPLSEFHKRVAEVAGRFKTQRWGQYDNVKIIEALTGKRKGEIDKGEFNRWQQRVFYTLKKLKKRGVIEQTRQKILPILQRATSADIRKHRGLIRLVLNTGHRFLRRDWRRYLRYNDAARIGEKGLSHAIEIFDKNGKFKFSSVATGCIANSISAAVRLSSRGEVSSGRQWSLDKLVTDRMERHEVVPASETRNKGRETDKAIKLLFRLHQQKKLPSLHLTVLALRLHGHNLPAIGRHYGVTKEAIRQIQESAKLRIKPYIGRQGFE